MFLQTVDYLLVEPGRVHIGGVCAPIRTRYAAESAQKGIVPVSPWESAVDLVSPNGLYRARISDASEIAMGAPTFGTLVVTEVSNGHVCARLDSINPSLVWSADSRALAAPQWTRERNQRLVIVSVPMGRVRPADQEFRVLELRSFQHGRVRGVDSPIHLPTPLDLDVEGLLDGDADEAP